MPDWSVLEYMARRTTASFSILESKGIDSRPPFAGPEAKGKEELAKVGPSSSEAGPQGLIRSSGGRPRTKASSSTISSHKPGHDLISALINSIPIPPASRCIHQALTLSVCTDDVYEPAYCHI